MSKSLRGTLVLLCFAMQDALVIAALTVFYHDRAGATNHSKDEYLAITARQQLLISLMLSGVLLVVGACQTGECLGPFGSLVMFKE